MRYLAIFAILLFAIPALATDWHKADSGQYAWDQPAQLADGTPLPTVTGWVYEVYTRDHPTGVIETVGTVTAENGTVTIPAGSKIWVGVAAAYVDADGVQSDFSTVAWSDEPLDCLDQTTFGFHNLKSSDKPTGLRKQ